MAIKNIKGLLSQATLLPAAIEAKLPAGAPKVSTMLLDTASKIPTVPDFPFEFPDLPAVPALPGMPTMLGMPAMPGTPAPGGNYVTHVVEVRETPASLSTVTPLVQSYTQPIEGVVGSVKSRRGM